MNALLVSLSALVAQTPLDPTAQPVEWAAALHDAVTHGQWWIVVSLVLIGGVALAKRMRWDAVENVTALPAWVQRFAPLALSTAGGFGIAVLAGRPPLEAAIEGAVLGLKTTGSYEVVLKPLTRALQAKTP